MFFFSRWSLVLAIFAVVAALSHVLWLGCMNENSIPSGRFNVNNSPYQLEEQWQRLNAFQKAPHIRNQLSRSLLHYVSSFATLPSLILSSRSDIFYNKCPVAPATLVSVFHLEWFYFAADIRRNGKALYRALGKHEFLTRCLLFFAAAITVVEWLMFWGFIIKLLWKGFLKPITRIASVIMCFHLLEVALPLFGPAIFPVEAVSSFSLVLRSINSYVSAILTAALTTILSVVMPIVVSSVGDFTSIPYSALMSSTSFGNTVREEL